MDSTHLHMQEVDLEWNRGSHSFKWGFCCRTLIIVVHAISIRFCFWNCELLWTLTWNMWLEGCTRVRFDVTLWLWKQTVVTEKLLVPKRDTVFPEIHLIFIILYYFSKKYKPAFVLLSVFLSESHSSPSSYEQPNHLAQSIAAIHIKLWER